MVLKRLKGILGHRTLSFKTREVLVNEDVSTLSMIKLS